jgi:hypothetical protein
VVPCDAYILVTDFTTCSGDITASIIVLYIFPIIGGTSSPLSAALSMDMASADRARYIGQPSETTPTTSTRTSTSAHVGHTVLASAAWMGHTPALRVLLERCVNVAASDESGPGVFN